MKYTYEISIEAATPQDAEAKLKAASVLMQKLSERDLTRLAEVVKNDPVKIAIAKKALGL